MAVVLLLLAALAGPAAAQSGRSSLRDVFVSPRLGGPTTTVRFGVTFQDRQDRPADAVQVLIDGEARTMALGVAAGSGHGLRYGLETKLVVGRHRIGFAATDADGRRSSADGGDVWIKSKSGATTPAAGSTAGPEGGTPAKPSSGGGSTAPKPKGTSSGGTSSPTTGGSHTVPDKGIAGRGGHDPAGTRAPGADKPGTGPSKAVPVAADRSTAMPTATDPTAADPAVTDPTSRAVIPPPGSIADTVADAGPEAVPADAPSGRAPAGVAEGGPSAARGLDKLGAGGSLFDQVFRAYPVLVTTSGTAIVWAAFVFFGKRRRDGEPPAPDEVLAVHAAAGLASTPAADLVPATSQRQLPPGVEPDEADLPRWRRPSLLQARKFDPLRMVSTSVSLSFADSALEGAAFVEGRERRTIRYRLVRLLDVPDEATGRELGVLDAGDEVQIVDEYGIYRLVLCPDGMRGWLHKMVLGELVDEDSDTDGPPDGIDEDVLSAFLAARQQTA